MKKILKRLLISTALITPIAISTPLLLTSCSIEETTSATGPSIFKPLSDVMKPTVDNTETLYVLSTSSANGEVSNISNKVIDELKLLTPGPSFQEQAKAIATKLFDNLEFEENNENAGNESINEYSWKSKNALKEEKDFKKLNEIINGLTLNNNYSNTTEPTPTTSISFNSNLIDLEKLAKLTDKIDTNVNIVVGSGTVGNPTKNVIETEIVIDISPKKDIAFTWDGLNNNHPIEINVEFFQDEKATLFDGGLATPPKYDDTNKAFIFNADLNKNVFGDSNINKITGTNKIREWFESESPEHLNSNSGTSTTITSSGLGSANTKVASKINKIFENMSNIKYKTVNGNQEADAEVKNRITSKYIVGANEVSTKPNTFANGNQILGKPNITATISKIAKKTANRNGNIKYEITLDFALNNVDSWFSFEKMTANKNGKIQFVLTVDLTK